MNKTIEQLLNRLSVRNFTGESISDKDLETIFKAALRCPTSINGQQILLIYTKDKALLKKIAKLCGGQKHIEEADVFVTFVIDFNRTDYALHTIGKEQVVEKSAEGIIVGAIDAGIMLSSLQTAAEGLGYASTAIGSVKMKPQEFMELLNLTPNTYPLVGSAIGVGTTEAKTAPLKPRVPLESFVFENKYDDKKVKERVETYRTELNEFRKSHEMDYKVSYKEQVASLYENFYMPQVKSSFEKQGFKFEDE